MSFRRRLTLFFVALVGLPMIAVAVLVVQVTEGSREGKADARLDVGLDTAKVLYDNSLGAARSQAARIAAEVAPLVRRDDGKELTRVIGREAPGFGVVAVTVTDPQGRLLAREGPPVGIATARSEAELSGGHPVATVEV